MVNIPALGSLVALAVALLAAGALNAGLLTTLAVGPLSFRSAAVIAADKLLHPGATQDVTLSPTWPTDKDRIEAWRSAFRAWELSKGPGVRPGAEEVKAEQILVPALKGGSRIPVTVYTPRARGGAEADPARLRPVLVWLHGGLWSAGSRNGTDPVARFLANEAGALVISVGYGLAPRRKYPTAVDEVGTFPFSWSFTCHVVSEFTRRTHRRRRAPILRITR